MLRFIILMLRERTLTVTIAIFAGTTLIVWCAMYGVLMMSSVLVDHSLLSVEAKNTAMQQQSIRIGASTLRPPLSSSALYNEQGTMIPLTHAGWKFHAGDSMLWRMNSYNDSAWHVVASTARALYAPELTTTQCGWYRLPISIDSSMAGQRIAFSLQGFRYYEVAWLGLPTMELYCNGQLIGALGKPTHDGTQDIAPDFFTHYTCTYVLPEQVGMTVLAMRISLRATQAFADQMQRMGGEILTANTGVNIAVGLPESAEKMRAIRQFETYLIVFCTAVPGIIGILHAIIFVAYRHNTLHLHLALHALFGMLFGITNIIRVNAFSVSPMVASINMQSNALLYSMIWISLILSVYSLTRKHIPLIAWLGAYILLLLRILIVTFHFADSTQLMGYIAISQTATNLLGGILVLSEIISAIRKGQREDYIILVGMIVLLIGMFVDMFFLGRFSLTGVDREPYIFIGTYFAFFIAMPLSMAVLIAYRSANNTMRIARFNDELRTRVAEQTQELTITNEALKKLNAEKNEFLGIAAHDLKNPLSAIMNYASLMAEPSVVAHTPKFAGIILESAERMTRLINNLLDVNAIESGKKFFRITDINLAEVVHNVLLIHSIQYERKRQIVHVEYDESYAYVIRADMNATMQIVENLLSNAIKYGPVGSTISIRLYTSETAYSLSFKDEGSGIPTEEIPLLFQKFTRLSSRPTANEDSTGLGLSIVKHLADEMGCQLRYEGVYGEGACFIVDFPHAIKTS